MYVISLRKILFKLENLLQSALKQSKYDQEMTQSHTADQPTAP